MPIPAGVYHVVWSGALPGGERWAAGYWKSVGTGPETAQEEAQAELDAAGSGSFFNSLEHIMGAGTTATAITVYQYRDAGGVSNDKGQVSLSGITGAGTGLNPDQISLVATLRSANITRAGRNRTYWPATGIAMAANGLFAAPAVNTFIDDFADLWGAGVPVIVSSSRTEHYPATAVDADYIPDQQTRRRRSLVSPRHSAAV